MTVKAGESLFEERPAVDPASATGEERKALDDAIRADADASSSDASRAGGASAGNGGGGGTGGGPGGPQQGPPFDREAAERARKATPYEEMRDLKGNPIYSGEEIELSKVDVKRLRKAKAPERKAVLERFAAIDLDDLQAKKDVLSDRKSAWVRRMVDHDEEAWRQGKRQAAAADQEAAKREFLEKVTGAEPWHRLNGLIVVGRRSGRVGPWAERLLVTEQDVETLAPATKLVIAKHADSIMAGVSLVPAELVFLGAVAIVFVPKGIEAYAAWKREREEREAKPKPIVQPGIN